METPLYRMTVVRNCEAMFANRRKLFHVCSYVTSGLPVCRSAHTCANLMTMWFGSEDSHSWLLGVKLRATTELKALFHELTDTVALSNKDEQTLTAITRELSARIVLHEFGNLIFCDATDPTGAQAVSLFRFLDLSHTSHTHTTHHTHTHTTHTPHHTHTHTTHTPTPQTHHTTHTTHTPGRAPLYEW